MGITTCRVRLVLHVASSVRVPIARCGVLHSQVGRLYIKVLIASRLAGIIKTHGGDYVRALVPQQLCYELHIQDSSILRTSHSG
jgi:hypothetical protein